MANLDYPHINEDPENRENEPVTPMKILGKFHLSEEEEKEVIQSFKKKIVEEYGLKGLTNIQSNYAPEDLYRMAVCCCSLTSQEKNYIKKHLGDSALHNFSSYFTKASEIMPKYF